MPYIDIYGLCLQILACMNSLLVFYLTLCLALPLLFLCCWCSIAVCVSELLLVCQCVGIIMVCLLCGLFSLQHFFHEDHALRAVEEFNNIKYNGKFLKVEVTSSTKLS